MDPRNLQELLEQVRSGAVSPAEAGGAPRDAPLRGPRASRKLDHHRALRRGFPEAVFGAGKTPEQIVAIVERIAARGQRVLVTRTTAEVHATVAAGPAGGALPRGGPLPDGRGRAGAAAAWAGSPIVAAGTSDLPVAEEAAVTAEFHGRRRRARLRRGRRGPAPPARPHADASAAPTW